jgi:transcriptional regulator with XRE-family HTH domain
MKLLKDKRKHLNVSALYAALDAKREGAGMSWRELATQLELSPSLFTRLAQGRQPDVTALLTMCDWLGVSVDRFKEAESPERAPREETVAVIGSYLRADRALKPESAQAIESLVRAAYDRLAEHELAADEAETTAAVRISADG